ncbi:MAG UNVERIFIED_CONTAM: hypothetical protein LVT10_07620 [Anaerolineae bacterium]
MTQNPQRPPNRQVLPHPSMVQGSESRQRQTKRRTTPGNEWTLVIVAGLLVFVAIASSALVALWFTLSQTQTEVIPYRSHRHSHPCAGGQRLQYSRLEPIERKPIDPC